MNHRINTLIQEIELYLFARYKDSTLTHQYAWWMLEEITQRKPIDLVMSDEITLSSAQEEKLNSWIKAQVENHEPLAYLIGWVPFMRARIFCKPPTLIPRPETEEWCSELIDVLKMNRSVRPEELRGHFSILDLATGSGCIAIALAQAFPHARIVATDVASTALELARQNAAYNNVPNIEFIQSDVYEHLPTGDEQNKFDLIISNPPYIAPEEWESLDTSVSRWEDPGALAAPDHGLAIIKKIIRDAHHWLKQKESTDVPRLVLEIGFKQGPAVKKLMEQAGFKKVEIKKDLAGKNRTVRGY